MHDVAVSHVTGDKKRWAERYENNGYGYEEAKTQRMGTLAVKSGTLRRKLPHGDAGVGSMLDTKSPMR